MLEYEWGANPSQIILTTTDDATHDTTTTTNPHQHLVEHYSATTHHHPHHQYHHTSQSFDLTATPATANAHIFPCPTTFSHFTTAPSSHEQHSQNVQSMFDPRGCGYGITSSHPHPFSPYSLDSFASSVGGSGSGGSGSSSHGFLIVPKTEEQLGRGALDFTARLGLNLGGRTYFSSSEDDFVNRLYRRSRPNDTGSMNVPRCQAEGCNADLTHAKHYHRRHKVCEFHSKAAAVIAAGLTQRFCQQCSRFHLLSEFDNGKRSCRKRLADHNRRRRKSHQPHQEIQVKSQQENARNNITSSYNLPKSPADSGTQSASSVTIAVSPPRMSLDSFRQRPHHQTTASSASSCSLFFSSG